MRSELESLSMSKVGLPCGVSLRSENLAVKMEKSQFKVKANADKRRFVYFSNPQKATIRPQGHVK